MDSWSFAGKRVAIAGCFSGMGEACARELVRQGAEVHGVDIKPTTISIASFTEVDLKDWSAVDLAVAKIGGTIDALFNCVGLPQTFPAIDLMRVNYLGIRHWTEAWLPRMKSGGAIASISSLSGMNWQARLPQLREIIALEGEEPFLNWVEQNGDIVGNGYGLSKELLNVWTLKLAVELAPSGIRANATMPSPTQTPMISAFEETNGAAVLNAFTAPTGRRSTAEEQAMPLIYLNSAAANFISGVLLPVDGGFHGGLGVGDIDTQALLAKARADAAASA